MFNFFTSPAIHRIYLRGADLLPSDKSRDEWHNREYARTHGRMQRVAEAADKKTGRR